jgi:hypothetical protein
MNQKETNQQEWSSPSNWRWSFYRSARDSRLWVPKRIPTLGWTLNLAHPRAATWLALFGLWLCLIIVLIAAVGGWSVLSSSPGPWLWLAGALALTLAAATLNPLGWHHLSQAPVALTFGILAAGIGFGIQTLLNGPVVALVGAANLTWRTHLYLALAGAIAQTTGKCLLILGTWAALRPADLPGKLRLGLMVGLGFTTFEILLLWLNATLTGSLASQWWLGACERGLSSLFHIYSAGLLALGLATRRPSLFALVIAVHYLTDWLAGANASLLHLPVTQLELLFVPPVAAVWLIFLTLTLRIRRTSP